MLSERLPNVPDITLFCKAFGVRRGTPVITIEPIQAYKLEMVGAFDVPHSAPVIITEPIKAKKPKRGRKAKSTPAEDATLQSKDSYRWWPFNSENSRSLLVSIPASKSDQVDEHEIGVRGPHADGSMASTTFSLPSGPWKRPDGLVLQFPTTQMRDAAKEDLRTHMLEYEGGDPFRLKVASCNIHSSGIIPGLNVEDTDPLSLLTTIVRFFPAGGHVPRYVYHVDTPQPPATSLRVAFARCPQWLRMKWDTPSSGFRDGSSVPMFLTANCTQSCRDCPLKVNVCPVDLPKAVADQ
ncbi:MAG: hypothetical protein Q9168_000129 [Polycauliona sp. 1 TL-2023]